MKRILLIALILIGILALSGCSLSEKGFVVIADQSDNTANVTDGNLNTLAKPYYVGIAEGDIAGHTGVNKFGYNSAVAATFETIWTGSTLYSYPSAAIALEISSDSASDNASGTGARTVQIYGLDGSYNELNETVSLNGTTSANTTGSYIRVLRMIVRSAGSGGSNAGVIYAGTGAVVGGVPATVYARIEVGYSQSLMAFTTIPASKTGYIIDLQVSSSVVNKVTTVALFVRPPGEVFQVKAIFDINVGFQIYDFAFPLQVVAQSDVEVRAFATAGGGDVSAAFSYWYE